MSEPVPLAPLGAPGRIDPVLLGLEVYEVGGAVRDALLGQPVQDRDYVVVGASPQALLDRGFTPVGQDFPVFLHPHTKAEYALARTERKTAAGYHGFAFHAAPDVTLEQDLARRDLTINAMARHLHTCELIDPYGGQADLKAGVLRHVSRAFAEDPVRILRLARFAARWPQFSVASQTLGLMQQMVKDGEVDALVAERVWQELAKGLMCSQPSRMFEVLRQCGALQVLMPEVAALWGVPQRADYHPEVDTGVHVMMVIDQTAVMQTSLPVRWAALCHDLGKATTPAHILPRHLGHEGRSEVLARALGQRLKVPSECQELALLVAREHGNIHASMGFGAAALLRLLERCDAFRRPDRFSQALQACEADARGRLGLQDQPYPQTARLQAALQAACSVNTADVAATAQARGHKGAKIAEDIHAARAQAIALSFEQRG